MTIPQPRRAKSSTTLRSQAQRPVKPPPLPSNVPSIPAEPSLPSDGSSRSGSLSSSGLRTPPQQSVRPVSPLKIKRAVTEGRLSGLSDRLNLVTSELESYVEENDDESVHVAVRLKPSFGKERDIWRADPVRGHIGGKLGEYFFGSSMMECANYRLCIYWRRHELWCI